MLPSLVFKEKGPKATGDCQEVPGQNHKSKGTEMQKYSAFEDIFSILFLLEHIAWGTVMGGRLNTYPGPRTQRNYICHDKMLGKTLGSH